MRKCPVLAGLMVLGVILGVIVGSVSPVMGQTDPTVAPPGQLSADGRSVSVPGGPTLSVSQAAGLTDGQSVTVNGSAFDENKGIYIALCAIPPANHSPSPCGGGQDREGGAGVSTWISSNPPSYGEGIAIPYGAGGTFSTSFAVSPMISPTIDCRVVACAIVTRNDHTRSTDRSQDLFIPVNFADPGGDVTVPPTTAPPASTTTAAPTTTSTTVVAPETVVADDGLSVSDGTRSLSASSATDLDPSGAEIDVSGAGYSDSTGVLVALCAIGDGDARPGPCTSGSAGASAWISSSPPDYGVDLAQPYGDGGTFAVSLTVPAVIDSETDCREVACAITTRPDDATPQDRSQELLLPVSFADSPAETTTTTTEADVEDDATEDAAPDEEGSSSSTPWLPIVIGLVLVVGAAVVVWRRRAASSTPDASVVAESTSSDPTDGPSE